MQCKEFGEIRSSTGLYWPWPKAPIPIGTRTLPDREAEELLTEVDIAGSEEEGAEPEEVGEEEEIPP